MSKARTRSGNVPSTATSFVGRRQQRKEIRDRLASGRLVSLIGPGGVGKTRLALHVADEMNHLFENGVYFVELASVSDGGDVPAAVVHALGIADQSNRDATAKLIEYLRDREILLILDNCEHVLPGSVALISDILRYAPSIRILATTRTSLTVTEEFLYPVPPLTVPDDAAPVTVESLSQFESIRLLQERAEAASPGFVLDEHNAAAAARLCIQLEGIPLAIELAVARMRILSLDQILERLTDRFGLLTSGSRSAAPRQQTLRSLVDWSFALCTEPERHLWARLSVFAGSFDLTSAEGVCGDAYAHGGHPATTTLDLLSSLVNQSIVGVEDQESSMRFRMLETIRAYGAEILALTGDSDRFRSRHRQYFLDVVQELERSWCGPDQAASAKWMRVERENLRAALDTAAAGDNYQLELIAGLRYRWYADGYIAEGRRWSDESLDAPDGDRTPTPARAKALWVAARVCLLQGDHEVAARRLDECEAVAAQLHLADAAAHCVGLRGLAAQLRGDLAEAESRFEVALRELADVGETAEWLMASFEYAVVLSLGGRSAEALAVSTSALSVCRHRGERWARSYLKWSQGLDHWLQGDFTAAHATAIDALRDHRVFDPSLGTALMTELLAWIAGSTGQFERAAQLIGASRSLWRRTGTELVAFGPKLTGYHSACRGQLEQAMAPRALSTALQAGAKRSPTGIIAYALAEQVADSIPEGEPPVLTSRQQEIAALISKGLTSPQIAAALVISARTVESHIENIMTRLGFASRSQIASWYIGQSR
ncbi:MULTISPECIES: LuxR C-terminal-related transcriptional regulator [unclassified Rhodococcus (in: high G+C Gram-positive bacteria)]|uniref:ATP-binding protein n=1 Tax=unclassified Rhodococcus (in: high G+C Gram-positive bacteria) TaxID=192944 RepID=UPI00163A50EB|nr:MULTISPECIES: LuxR C-terminal-related transcriptional regulator [unclassified Rhodococcus (in: high G+C Gram-positive bacteria)]MBC2639177.1 AAA family ATPase [Rhodococcus sp. 3A]MBC2896080.1 AAA family ATPase [Rhodococcus sp. 4CII]